MNNLDLFIVKDIKDIRNPRRIDISGLNGRKYDVLVNGEQFQGRYMDLEKEEVIKKIEESQRKVKGLQIYLAENKKEEGVVFI